MRLRMLLPFALAAATTTAVPSAATATAAVVSSLTPAHGVVGPASGMFVPTRFSAAGRTALFAISPPSDATVHSVTVTLANTRVGVGDFDPDDGFAVYASDTFALPSPLQPARASGLWEVRAARGDGTAQVRIPVDPAIRARFLFVAVHPATRDAADRDVELRLERGAVETSGGNVPGRDVTTGMIKVDSQPPAAPSGVSVVQQVAPFEDEVVVSTGGLAPDTFVVAANAATPVTLETVLRRPNGAPVISMPADDGSVRIGNGTGLTDTVTVAANNQKSDQFFVAAADLAQNVSPVMGVDEVPTTLWNDVTAPSAATLSVALDTGTSGVNRSNRMAVGIVATDKGAAPAVSARIVRDTPAPDATRDHLLGTAPADLTGLVDGTRYRAAVDVLSLGPADGLLHAEAVAMDDFGNRSDAVRSAQFWHLLRAPSIERAQVVAWSAAEKKVLVTFDAPMDPASVAELTSAPDRWSNVDDIVPLTRDARGTERTTWGVGARWEWVSNETAWPTQAVVHVGVTLPGSDASLVRAGDYLWKGGAAPRSAAGAALVGPPTSIGW